MQLLISRKAAIIRKIIYIFIDMNREEVRRAAYAGMSPSHRLSAS